MDLLVALQQLRAAVRLADRQRGPQGWLAQMELHYVAAKAVEAGRLTLEQILSVAVVAAAASPVAVAGVAALPLGLAQLVVQAVMVPLAA